MIKLIFGAFTGAGIMTKLIVAGGVVLSVLAAGGIIYHNIWSRGYDKGHAKAIQEIAEADERALSAARSARNRVLSCRASDGMRWDTTTGECLRR